MGARWTWWEGWHSSWWWNWWRRHVSTHHTRRRGNRSDGWQGDRRSICKQLMGSVCLRQRVLCSQQSLSCRAVSLPLGVLLECIGDGNCSVTQILAIHSLNSSVRSLKAGIVDKSKPFRISSFRISLNLGCGQNNTKSRESVIQQFLINFRVQISNENISSNIQVLLVS